MWRVREGRDTGWNFPVESGASSYRVTERANPSPTPDTPFFEAARAAADETYEAPTVGERLFKLGADFSVILGLCLLVELLLVAYGVPKV